MFCRYCGKNIKEDSEFCPFCGKKLSTAIIMPVTTYTYQEPATSQVKSDEYYQKEAEKLASSSLQSVCKIFCYTALAVFLLFSLKMAPFYGTAQIIAYIVMAVVAVCLVALFNKKILPGRSKSAYNAVLWFSIIVIAASIGLRVVYESKVDAVEADFSSSSSVYVTMTFHTDYFNATGTGTIRNPSSHIMIGDAWYDNGDSFEVTLNKQYDMRVGAGGSGSGGYIDTTITFMPSSFIDGKYVITKGVRITSGPASLAEVTVTFRRFCPFWDVIFY